jgi:hypothetical protein
MIYIDSNTISSNALNSNARFFCWVFTVAGYIVLNKKVIVICPTRRYRQEGSLTVVYRSVW